MKNAMPRRSTRKDGSALQTVAEYFADAPEAARTHLRRMRAVIRSAAPRDATETISYKIPAFAHHGVVVWYAAFANHVSLFPTSAVIGMFRDDLKNFATSKGTVRFPLDKPLPAPLIRKIVKARVAKMKAKMAKETE